MSNAEEYRWQAAWLRGGRISEVAWIGHDVLGWTSGLRIVFFEALTNKLRMPRLPDDIVIAGASCLSGHLSQRIFAFAEKNPNPRIFVYMYPSIKKLSECTKGSTNAYVATAFAGDYLVSQDSLPHYKLIVWCWRSGEKLHSVDTSIHDIGDLGQTLRINFTLPTFIAQIGNTCGKLLIWEMTVCSSTIILNQNEVILPNNALVKDAAWCPNSNDILAIADRDGHIYLSNSNGSDVKRVVLSQRCDVCVEVEPAAICWYRGGIILRTTFCQIRYYQKNEKDFWKRIWYTKSKNYPLILTSHPFRNDRLFYLTREGDVVKIDWSEDAENPTLNIKYFYGGKYTFLEYVHPWDDHIVAIDAPTDISVIDAHKGNLIAKINLDIIGSIICMLSHLEYPLVVVSSDKGEIVFISLLFYNDPKILGKCRLQSEALDHMKFSSLGRYLVVCQKELGICYLLSVSHTQPINVITRLDVRSKIADILLFDSPNGLKFYLLYCSVNVVAIGHKLFLYDLPNGANELQKVSRIFCFDEYFKDLHYMYGDSNGFVGMPYLTKHLKFFKIQDWNNITCSDALLSGHHIRQVKVFTDKHWLITTGIGGTSVIRSIHIRSKKHLHLLTHHRRDIGAKKSIVNFKGNLLIALGTDGSIVSLSHRDSEYHYTPTTENKFKNLDEFAQSGFIEQETKMEEYLEALDEPKIEFLSKTVNLLTGYEGSDSITWVEWKERQLIENERIISSNEKIGIIENLTVLKNKIIDLLNKNETCADFEKLPISAFALDKVLREKKLKAAKDEREETRHKSELDCFERDRLANWIKNNLWDSQKSLAQSIFGIFDEIEVTNYSIDAPKKRFSHVINFAQFTRSLIKELTYCDPICLWKAYTPEELISEYDKQLIVKNPDDVEKFGLLIYNEEENEVDTEDQNERYLYEGMTTHRFIDPFPFYYSQFKIYAFAQILCDSHNIQSDTNNLRMFFNKKFDEMYYIKEREMSLVRERIDRILFINYELQIMFNEFLPETFAYPEWNVKEKSETIIHVTDDELFTKVYVSPSQQEILDRQAAEEERTRLALLADDFRERALQAMMDGVLEVRWEDLIKRDVPKPECMLVGKKSEDYTDEDVLAVKRYETESRNLQIERERYRKLLFNDYAKIKSALREGIEKFNSRLEEFHMLKIKVETAIQQLNLRNARYFAKHVQKLHELNLDRLTIGKIEETHKSLSLITEEIKVIQNIEQELHDKYENLYAKDKQMEKKLKNDFTTLGKNAFSIITMQYKRRPRIVLKTVSSAEVLDLGKSITSMEKLPYLTSECLEYLRQLEILDIRSTNLPASIEATHWDNLVALRRLKIDHELKQKAVALELEEVASALANNNNKLAQCRTAIASMSEQLKRSRAARMENELDAEVQLIFKMGQMEIATLKGDVAHDTAGAILVPQSLINEINEEVLNAGRKKLRAIERSLEFRKSITVEEWEHRCLKARLKHLGVKLYYVRLTNVTREIREFLRKKAIGEKEEKTAQKMDKRFETTSKNQEKMLKNWEGKLNNVRKEVHRIRRKNEVLDKKVIKMNVNRWDMELKRDIEGETRQKDFKERILKLTAERSAVIRKLLKNYEELLEICKERENLTCTACVPVKLVPKLSSYEDED